MAAPDVMTIDELAEHLQRPRSTLYKLAREGSLPGSKVGGRWQFHREDVEWWSCTRNEDRDIRARSDGFEAQAGRIEIFNAEEVAAAAPWDGRINQISAGSYHSTLKFIKTSGMVLYEHYERHGIEGFGSLPSGLIVLATNIAWRQSDVEWCGRTLDHHRFACGSSGSEIGFTIPARGRNVVLLADERFLASTLSRDSIKLLRTQRHIEFSANNGQWLASAMRKMLRRYVTSPELLEVPRNVRDLQSRFFETLSGCISQRAATVRAGRIESRPEPVRRAIDFAERSSAPITARRLAAAASVSQRTLQDLFRERLGVSPGVYLRRLRLNKAHRALAAAHPGSTTVSKIAMDWGFPHTGRFSVTYRQMFDEMPSVTLGRPPHIATPRPLDPFAAY
jgi:excisionase family DNA binding protein